MTETNGNNLNEAELDAEHWLHAYEQMIKIRTFEIAANELYTSARMPGIAHLYIGEEAIAVGICEALRQDDYITSTHRARPLPGQRRGAGQDVRRTVGQGGRLLPGKGGSMHIADQETGNLGANGIVGGSSGIATGAGMSIKLRGTDQVAVCFFGDGALGQGLLYESMNMAQLWKLPVIYVCENNQYGEYTHNSKTAAGTMIGRATAFGVHALGIDGQDIRTVHATARLLVDRARKGGGPAFIVCDTYRFHGHHVGDIDRPYRTREEEAEWAKRDPVKLLEDWLLKSKQTEAHVFERIQEDVKTAVDEAVAFALETPFPNESEVNSHVYA